MKKIIIPLILIFSLLLFSVNVSAKMPNVVDNADVLNTHEENLLTEKISQIQDNYKFEVVIVTTEDLQGKSTQDYADDFYDENGYGLDSEYSGALLLIDMGTSSWYVSTTGFGMDAIDQGGFYYIEQDMLPYLSQRDFYSAFDTYISICQELLEYEINGYEVPLEKYEETYNYYNNSVEVTTADIILISVIIGIIVAFISVLVMKSKLKTVKSKVNAADYVRQGSLNLTHSSEHFLYRNVTRTKRQSNNSSSGGGTHVSSSGRTHGGGGGRF